MQTGFLILLLVWITAIVTGRRVDGVASLALLVAALVVARLALLREIAPRKRAARF